MSSTLIRPPSVIKKMPRYGGGGGKLYTIHSTYKDIFTVQRNERTAVLAFRREDDAISFGKLLETSYEIEKKWPMFTLENDDLWFKYEERDLNHLTVINWESETLKTMCMTHDFGMIDIKKMSGMAKLSGVYYSWEADHNFWCMMLEEKLTT